MLLDQKCKKDGQHGGKPDDEITIPVDPCRLRSRSISKTDHADRDFADTPSIFLLRLLGWALPIREGAKHTTGTHQRAEDCTTTGALIEHDSGVGRHLLLPGKPALWTGNDRLEFCGHFRAYVTSFIFPLMS